MYHFSDVIKSGYLHEIEAVSVETLLTTLLLAFVLGVFITAVYRLTYSGVMFSWNFALSLILLSLVTSLVILAVSSNVVLSLGMVGALSIVRFRTAVKDVMDTVFMFWAIASGIITGAGYMTIALIATGVVGLLFIVVCLARQAVTAQSYMLIIRCSADTELEKALSRVAPYRVRSKTLSADGAELVAELRLGSRNFKKSEALVNIPGVEKLDIVSYNGDTLL
ncbi:MAG: DUF4956 domain-containing protein [Oscillospiraceae bacterium]|nr:DUF4956 domain-containing protein [Oscillospiraceae bacterium]